MSTIINIANELQALQGRITADKAALLEARAVMEAENDEEAKGEKDALDTLIAAFNNVYQMGKSRRESRHARLMAFIDGQIAAKDEAIEGEFKQAAE